MRDFIKKSSLALATGFASAAVFAEGTSAASGITADLVTTYVTEGKDQVLAVLTAGAVIVGAFFVWGVIKKALNRSK